MYRYASRFNQIYKRSGNYIISYRTLQLLGNLLNECQQESLSRAQIPTAIGAQCVGTAALIKMKSMGIFTYLMIAQIAFNGFLCQILLLGMMSKVFVGSKRVQQHCNRVVCLYRGPGIHGMNRRLARRYIRSSGLIKAKFGSSNFIDSVTPLNCVDLANALTVQLLLISGKL